MPSHRALSHVRCCGPLGFRGWAESDREAKEEKARKEAQEQARRAEAERQWNSPEAVKRREVEAKRLRAEAEEKERQRKAEEERLAREKWQRYHRFMRVEEVDGMTGTQFKLSLKTLLQRSGYDDVRDTPGSGDQGADLTCRLPGSGKMVVQAKRWKGPVGNSAVQEILGALHYYDAEVAMVITNSSFTESARALARKASSVRLVDRAELADLIRRVFPQEVPEFDGRSTTPM